jgi:ABC-type branched-subunit amino acid transport system substrate-binding protein
VYVTDTGSLTFDFTGIDAAIGFGFETPPDIFLDIDEIYIGVLGTSQYKIDQSTDKLTFTVSSTTLPPNPSPSPVHNDTTCSGANTLSTSSFIICVLLLGIFFGNGKLPYFLVLLCGLQILVPVQTVPSVIIQVYLPNHYDVDEFFFYWDSIIIKSNNNPILSDELWKSGVTIDCPTCAHQLCLYPDTNNCILSNTSVKYVGVLVPLSAASANHPQSQVDSIQYYLNFAGFASPQVQFIYADTAADPVQAVTIAQELNSSPYGVKIFIGPSTSSELQVIQNDQSIDAVFVSPTATSTAIIGNGTSISLSFSNELYVYALDMTLQKDFWNTLSQTIVIYRDDSFGQDLTNIWQNEIIQNETLSYNLTLIPYNPSYTIAELNQVLTQASAAVIENVTAIVVVSYGEINDILFNAQSYPGLSDLPWYSVSLSFNLGVTNTSNNNLDFAQSVTFRTVEFRGSNIQDQTVIRSEFYENITALAEGNPLPNYMSLVADAALLILNTPDVFTSGTLETYEALIYQSGVIFGFSGWLTLGKDGFRQSGDLVIELVVNQTNLADDWVEIGYIEVGLHTYQKEAFYIPTARRLGNYIIPGDWADNCTDVNPYANITARNIARQFTDTNIMFDQTQPGEDISIPLYDTVFISYGCNGTVIEAVCPSALFGSDSACLIYIGGSKKRNTTPPSTTTCGTSKNKFDCRPRTYCNNTPKNETCHASTFNTAAHK